MKSSITTEAPMNSRSTNKLRWVIFVSLTVGLAAGIDPLFAQTFVSGSTGADGAFNPAPNTTPNLPPNGIFNFTTGKIPAGGTGTFYRNAPKTPWFMLASGE